MSNNANKKILIIEDEDFLRTSLAGQLSDRGYMTVEAANGRDGMDLILKEQPDLVLLDLMLPKMPGEQILKEMNDNGLIQKIPVVVMTVKADDASAKNCVDILGAKEYLNKSDYGLEEIVNKIETYLV